MGRPSQTRGSVRGMQEVALDGAEPAAMRGRISAQARATCALSRLGTLFARMLLPAALLSTSACASSHYMGVALTPGAADQELQSLASRARSGDKQAQLDLGIRFEEGKGVPVDKARAKALYRQAAADSGGPMWIYMPSPGNGAKGRVVPVDTGPKQAGRDEAKRRLEMLGE